MILRSGRTTAKTDAITGNATTTGRIGNRLQLNGSSPPPKKKRKVHPLSFKSQSSSSSSASSLPPAQAQHIDYQRENQINCGICLTDFDFKDTSSFDCSHVYCTSCLAHHLRNQMEEGNFLKIKCPHLECLVLATPELVKSLVTDDLYQKYDQHLLNNVLEDLEDVFSCPRKDCHAAVEPNMEIYYADILLRVCPACNYYFCTNCMSDYHGNMPCLPIDDEFKRDEILLNYKTASEQDKKIMELKYGKNKLESLLNDELCEEWKKNQSKQCPKCKSNIEKKDGCNKLVCYKCKTKFCWLCLEVLKAKDPYHHFNKPNATCTTFPVPMN